MTSLRSSWLTRIVFLLGVCFTLVGPAWPGPDKEDVADAQALKDAGISTDEAALLEFFKKRTTSTSQHRLIGELIKQLGDNDFAAREQATRDLKGLGTA